MHVSKAVTEWKTYRTRFLIKAKQLTETSSFVDPLGREHQGRPGDYLVESSDGVRRIAPREIFEDVYVPMGLVDGDCSSLAKSEVSLESAVRRSVSRRAMTI